MKTKTKKASNKLSQAATELNEIFSKISLMILFLLKLDFGNKSVRDKIGDARRVITNMTGNPNFPTPTPALADVTIAADAAEVAEDAMDGSRTKTVTRNLRVKELTVLMQRLLGYVESVAGDNVEVAQSSGFLLRDAKTPVGILPAPEWMKGKSSVTLGQVDLKWKSVKKNSGYLLQWTQDPTYQSWPDSLPVEKASASISGLNPGERYYFRVATLSHEGWAGYSPIATVRLIQE